MFLFRCLQEISYLTSPQAMNPLPNRPLLNSSIPLSLPNVPSFDQLPYNGRPRKVLPEGGKEFPLLNGVNSMSSSSPTPATSGSQIPLLERNNSLASGNQPLGPTAPSGSTQRASSPNAAGDKERESETDSRHVTTIYRPDDDGEWKEKLKQSREHSEQAQLAKENQTGVHAWELRRDDDDNDFKDSEADIEEEESSIIAEGDDAKVWKAKRTLRKSVLIKS